MEPTKIKEVLRLFITNINQHVNASLGLELTIPDFIASKTAIGPFGKYVGKYADFFEESQILASLIIEIFTEESVRKPLFNPKIILKIRPETFANEKAKAMLLKAHQLASEKGTPYFANLLEKDQRYSVFSGSGFKLKADLNGDWEIDTLRTGCLGCVTINLPRITYESGKDKTKFFEIFRERFEMATRALEIKDRALKQHGKGLLPFLMQSVNGDHYFRLENCSRIVNLAGLKEALEAFNEKDLDFAEEIMQNILVYIQKIGRKRGKCLSVAILDFEASERLVQLDIERYGIAKVRFSGTREKPFYSTISKLIFQDGKISPEPSKFERKMRGLDGGNLTVIDLGEVERKPDELLPLTKQMFEVYNLEFLIYNRKLTYCVNCKRSWFGLLHKCPSCEATSTLTYISRN